MRFEHAVSSVDDMTELTIWNSSSTCALLLLLLLLSLPVAWLEDRKGEEWKVIFKIALLLKVRLKEGRGPYTDAKRRLFPDCMNEEPVAVGMFDSWIKSLLSFFSVSCDGFTSVEGKLRGIAVAGPSLLLLSITFIAYTKECSSDSMCRL